MTEADIGGVKYQVEFDTQGNLVLADGSRYELLPLTKSPFNFSDKKLASINRLVWENGAWLADGKPLAGSQKAESLAAFLKAEFVGNLWIRGLSAVPSKPRKSEAVENPWTKGLSAIAASATPPPDIRNVRAAAWFLDVADPVLLRNFPLLPVNPKTPPKDSAPPIEPTRPTRDAEKLIEAAVRLEASMKSTAASMKSTAREAKETFAPIHLLYKDSRMAAVRQKAIQAELPEIVIDTITSLHHTKKFPSIDDLFKYCMSSGVRNKLEAAGFGISRSTFSRWLRTFRKLMVENGLLTKSRVDSPEKSQEMPEAVAIPEDTVDMPTYRHDQDCPKCKYGTLLNGVCIDCGK